MDVLRLAANINGLIKIQYILIYKLVLPSHWECYTLTGMDLHLINGLIIAKRILLRLFVDMNLEKKLHQQILDGTQR